MKMQNNTNTGYFVRKKDMARILGVSVRTLENWMTARIIPYQKIGKVVSFNPDSVRAAIERKYTVGTLY
jgi:phage terminase Nu1 subunit (DNA packaging protein)